MFPDGSWTDDCGETGEKENDGNLTATVENQMKITLKSTAATVAHSSQPGIYFSYEFPINYSVSLFGKRVLGLFGFAFQEADGLGGVRSVVQPQGLSTKVRCLELKVRRG